MFPYPVYKFVPHPMKPKNVLLTHVPFPLQVTMKTEQWLPSNKLNSYESNPDLEMLTYPVCQISKTLNLESHVTEIGYPRYPSPLNQ